jgi:hypothetical protein
VVIDPVRTGGKGLTHSGATSDKGKQDAAARRLEAAKKALAAKKAAEAARKAAKNGAQLKRLQ